LNAKEKAMLNETILTIWMFGLMTHVGNDKVGGPDKKEAVAIVSDTNGTHHRPVMYVEDSHGGWLYEFRQGDHVRFEEGVTAGRAAATAEFTSYTPTLFEPLTNSLLDEPVKEKRTQGRVVAWIHYPQGTLGIVGLKYSEAKFFRGNDFVRSQCVPASSWFDAPTHDRVAMIITHDDDGSSDTYHLDPNAFILVVNESEGSDPSRHFANYGGLLERRFGVIPRAIARVEEGNPCDHPEALPPNMTLGDFIQQLGNRSRFARVKQLNLRTGTKGTSRVSHSALAPDLLLRILVSDDPACTNTDWP
jgi:hypothetical protein